MRAEPEADGDDESGDQDLRKGPVCSPWTSEDRHVMMEGESAIAEKRRRNLLVSPSSHAPGSCQHLPGGLPFVAMMGQTSGQGGPGKGHGGRRWGNLGVRGAHRQTRAQLDLTVFSLSLYCVWSAFRDCHHH